MDTPSTSFEFICKWFQKAADGAKTQNRSDSAALWEDGLQHLKYLHAECQVKQTQIDELMLEYCPEKMTSDQYDDWEENYKLEV